MLLSCHLETLKSSENLDVVVMGEGEETMVDILDQPFHGSSTIWMRLKEFFSEIQRTGNLKTTPETTFNKGP